MSSFNKLAAFLALSATTIGANGHIIMANPVPYSVDKIDSSPITASQFPCKSQNGFTVSTMNNMKVGEDQTISFKGTAVHGGGSCQLAYTHDTEPTPKSSFKVIMSIEGGCPGTGEGTGGQATNNYTYTLPDNIPSGKGTFAWTWFSKESGAPELYMNCAPIDVTGGASDTSKLAELPDLFVANIGEGCTSPQNFATQFPNPGKVVKNGGTNDLKPPTGNCGASAGGNDTTPASSGSPSSSAAGVSASSSPADGANNGQHASSTASSVSAYSAVSNTPVSQAPAAASSPAAGSPAGQLTSTVTAMVTVTGTLATSALAETPVASSAMGAAPSAATIASSLAAAASSAAPVQSSLAAAPSGSTGGYVKATCSTNGQLICNGPSEFGLCSNGEVLFMPVAAGTTCQGGAIQKRKAYTHRVQRSTI